MDNRALVYKVREVGRNFCCSTEGSSHYKQGGIEPFDLMIAKGLAEDFAIGNMIKYAIRFKQTRNIEDLKKVSDYSHLLCGIEILKEVEDHGQGSTTIQDPIQGQDKEPENGDHK